MSAALRDALARALHKDSTITPDEIGEAYYLGGEYLCAALRSDPEVLQAVAEALRGSGGLDKRVNEWTVAARLLDHLLGAPR